MPTELSKTYDPAEVEKLAYQTWLDEKAFHAEPGEPGEGYSIVIPPPNVTGALHLGHAINNTLQDILTRKHRMDGFNAVWIPGIDHAGIATQAVVEKQLKEQENKTRHDVGREGLVERIWKWKEQYGNRILSQLQRLGASCDWDRTRFTLDEQCARAVRHTFFKLFKDGLIYRGKRLVNWDIFLQTSISDDEIYHETVKTSLWHIRYPIEDSGPGSRVSGLGSEIASSSSSPEPETRDPRPVYMVVATTRPETMLGDTAVAVHSEDPRWNWAIGKHVRLPLTGRLIPIIADDILVDPKFGSGVVKVTPAHDPNDYAVWQRHQGKPDQIELLNILTPDGKINEVGGPYAGLRRDQARKKVVEDLARQGLLLKEEPYETQVGHSDRSKTPVEPYLSDQWFVKMAPLAEPALEVVRNGTIKFYPERHAQQYLAWLGEKRDWPISRQLWWGHRIPVWTFTGTLTEEKAKEVTAQLIQWEVDGLLEYQQNKDAPTVRTQGYFCPAPHAETTVVPYLESHGFTQDPDVLDTWFSSALWPHSTLGWPEQTAALKKWYPTSVLLTGRDIITLWVARMVMTGMYNMGDRSLTPSPGTPGEGRGGGSSPSMAPQGKEDGPLPNPPPEYRERAAEGRALGIPFYDVAINPTILDEHGKRMSKSAGNGVDPVDIIETHGADALRFTLTTMATETQDTRMPVKIVCPKCGTLIANPESAKVLTVTCPKCKTTVTRPLGLSKATDDAPLGRMTSEKFDLGRNFCTKLWNAFRFAISNLESIAPEPVDEQKWSLVDRWIVSRFNRTVEEANAALKQYRFDVYAKACYDFFWRDFCDWYVEATKPALRDPQRSGQAGNVLASVLDGALRLMHPVIPFITEILWWRLNEVRPQRGLPGRIEPSPDSPRLIKAAWPKVGDFSEAAEHIFPRIQEIVGAIRNVRNDYKVDPKKPVTVSIAPPGAEAARATRDNREVIELLAVCKVNQIEPNLAMPANSVRTTANNACEIFVENMVDPEAEKQRAVKQRAELEKKIASLEGRLNNPGYMAKAPPKLVQQTNDELAAARAELEKLSY